MRAAWAFTALLVPVVGTLLYLAAYRRPKLNPGEGMPKWLRPTAIQAASGTAMGFGYGAPLMIAIGYEFAYTAFLSSSESERKTGRSFWERGCRS